MLIVKYPSKKNLKENIGKPLKYIETSLFGDEYLENGELIVANRPQITNTGREWFGTITMENGFVKKVT